MINKAFTLVELLVIMGIILTLAGIAISQGGSTQRSLSYSEAFNRTVDFVQKARTKAVTAGTENEETVYGVYFNFVTDPATALFFEGTTSTALETKYTYPDNVKIDFAGCNSSAEINFQGKSTVELKCDGTDTLEDSLTAIVSREDDPSKTKTMYIHKSVGVPQVVK